MGAAEKMIGLNLPGEWRVLSQMPISTHGTGGNFSVGYVVENRDGRRAFLKALDFSRALRTADPARALQTLTETFNFERDVLNKCKHMDRVVTAITDGSVKVNDAADGVVQYLIFELADGDARSQADVSRQFDLAWALRALHHVATGIQQLHSENIAHQDLKPSNVLVFAKRISKIADLGRAAYKGHIPPHDKEKVAGDPTYAPPELLYGFLDPDWNRRRLGCDVYLLGSMTVFFFTGAGTTAQLLKYLHASHKWGVWSGSYDDVLPYVRSAFEETISDFKKVLLSRFNDNVLAEELVAIVKQLCEPDPRLRGHQKNIFSQSQQYSLERFVARFDLLASRAEIGMFKKKH